MKKGGEKDFLSVAEFTTSLDIYYIVFIARLFELLIYIHCYEKVLLCDREIITSSNKS
jgi:hypothetical protein